MGRAKRTANRKKRSKVSNQFEFQSVNIGPDFQADIPDLISEGPCPKSENENDRLIWAPNFAIDDKALKKYAEEVREKHGYSHEQSLGMLYWNDYNFEKTRADVYNYVPTPDEWSKEEKALFEDGFKKYGKNFNEIHRMLPDKPFKSLIKYYYSWKKTRFHTSLIDEQVKLSAHKDDGRKKKMPSSSSTGKQSTSHKRPQNETKLPDGMHCNSEEIVAIITDANGKKDVSLHNMDYEITSLKKRARNSKKMINQLEHKISRCTDENQPTEGKKQIKNNWTNDEYLLAVQGMRRYGKNFKSIAEVMETKNEIQVKNFYNNFRQRFNLDHVLQEHNVKYGIAIKSTKRKEETVSVPPKEKENYTKTIHLGA